MNCDIYEDHIYLINNNETINKVKRHNFNPTPSGVNSPHSKVIPVKSDFFRVKLKVNPIGYMCYSLYPHMARPIPVYDIKCYKNSLSFSEQKGVGCCLLTRGLFFRRGLFHIFLWSVLQWINPGVVEISVYSTEHSTECSKCQHHNQ